jgi:hypothetical protein
MLRNYKGVCEDGSPWFFPRAPKASLKFAMPIENDAESNSAVTA